MSEEKHLIVDGSFLMVEAWRFFLSTHGFRLRADEENGV
jgi:hypothetical protein